MDEQIESALRRFRDKVGHTKRATAAAQDEARALADRILAMCPNDAELKVSGEINPHRYPPLPTDGPIDDRRYYDRVEYSIRDGKIFNKQNLPVDSSAAIAEEFLTHCRTGLIDLIAERVQGYIQRGGL